MPRPEFIIIDGPNGAGESRLSPFYINGKAFDGDLLAMKLKTEHPDWQEHWYAGTVAYELEQQKNAALEKHESFAFETNFSTDLAIEMTKQFKQAGYKICLYYFGLDTLDNSIERVKQRVALGGHNVADDVVEYNFTEGRRRTIENLHLFDNLTFIDGTSGYGRIVALHIHSSGLHEVANNAPRWFAEYFAKPFATLTNNDL